MTIYRETRMGSTNNDHQVSYIDAHAHLHRVQGKGNNDILEMVDSLTGQMKRAKIGKTAVMVHPSQVGLYDGRYKSPYSIGDFPHEEAFQNYQRNPEQIQQKVIQNPNMIKFLRLDKVYPDVPLDYLAQMMRDARNMNFVGIKLHRGSGLLRDENRLIHRALSIGLKIVQFHFWPTFHHAGKFIAGSEYTIRRFTPERDTPSLPEIANDIILRGGKLYLAHGASLPYMLNGPNTPEWNAINHGAKELLELPVYLGTSALTGVGSNYFTEFKDYFDYLKENHPQLLDRIVFETDFPFTVGAYQGMGGNIESIMETIKQQIEDEGIRNRFLRDNAKALFDL